MQIPRKKHYRRSEQHVPKQHDPLHLAYMAGIIDGEGSITMGNYSFTAKKTPQFTTYLAITTTDIALCEWLMNTFTGKFHKYTARQIPENSRRTPYRWQVTGNRLTDILSKTLPYLIIKKYQAEIMLKMRETYNNRFYMRGKQGPSISKELIAYRFSLAKELRSCHIRNSSIKHDL